jgi:tetratricopeptide (TPR) repeat protein
MFKVIRLSALVILFLFFSPSFAQRNKTVDSLEVTLKNPKVNDTVKINGIIQVSRYYPPGDSLNYVNNLLGKFAAKALKKNSSAAVNKKCRKSLGYYYALLANDYTSKGDFIKSLEANDKSIAAYKSIKDYKLMNFQLISRAKLYSLINDNEKAIATLFNTLKYFEQDKTKYANPIAYIHTTLADVYSQQGNYKKSIEYDEKCLAYLTHKKKIAPEDEWETAITLANIGWCYYSLKDYNKATVYFMKSLPLSKKVGNKSNTSTVLTHLGSVNLALGKLDEAEKFFKEAFTEAEAPLDISNCYMRLGELYNKKKEYKKADFYLTKALAIAKEHKNYALQEEAAEILFKVSKESGDFKKALEMHQLHDEQMDYAKLDKSKNLMEKQQLKYDFDKKEFNYKLASQKKTAAKNNWLIGLSGVLLLVLLGLYFYYRNNKQKQAITVLEKDQIKQKLLVSQMNPHFIFNSIENIQQLIYDKKDNDAVNYLNKFSILTRQILENSNETYISLSEEVAMTENYLAIQQLLYSNKFDFTITIEETIDADTIFLPPMLTQPFIENAIKHGLSNKDENGMIDIRFYLNNEKLFFEVLDNGKGFDASKTVGNHKSLAMTITKERLVNYTKNQDFVVQTDNIKDNDEKVIGAKVVFEIPYIYEN